MNYQKTFAFLLIGSFLLLNSCSKSETPSTSETVEQEEGASETTEDSSAESTEAEAEIETEAETEEEASGGEGAGEQIATIIGTKQDGWLPKIIAGKGLKRDMNPEEASKILPGAEDVSQFGFSEVKVNDVPGLQGYELYFAKNDAGEPKKLQAIKLAFDPDLKDQLSFEEAAKEISKKYGEYKEVESDGKITSYLWIGPKFASASLDNFGGDFEGYELNVRLSE